MNKRFRQYIGIVVAIVTYYVVHEGAHLICAASFGVFKQIIFSGIGMQIDVYREKMEDSSWNSGELYSAPRESVSELLETDACNKSKFLEANYIVV